MIVFGGIFDLGTVKGSSNFDLLVILRNVLISRDNCCPIRNRICIIHHVPYIIASTLLLVG